MNRKLFIRCMAFVLAALICLGLVSVIAYADTVDYTNMLRAPEDLRKVLPEDGPGKTFWGQPYIHRSWVKTITFQDTMDGRPENYFDLSAKYDCSVVGWYKDHDLVIAANGKIRFNENSNFMFAYFSNLEELNFNGCVDTSSVKDFTSMFLCCRKLKTLDVTGFDTSAAKSLDRMFCHCEGVEALDVAHFVTDNCTDFAYMFFFCKNLKAVDVSHFNTENAQYMNSMFYGDEKLETLDLTNFNTSKVFNMAYMFSGCTSLKDVDLSSFDTSKVQYSFSFMDDGVTVNGQPWKALFK